MKKSEIDSELGKSIIKKNVAILKATSPEVKNAAIKNICFLYSISSDEISEL